jgi:Ca2+-transporting ATPase
LCNNSRLNPPTLEHPHWTSLGDQTEVALTVTANKARIPLAELFASWPRIHELPFDARRKRMSTIHRGPNQTGQVAFVKGAPREVIALCTHVLIDGQAVPLDARIRAEVLEANDEYASRALRVLALARRELSDRTGSYSVERIEQGLTLLGLMAMMDPPRPEVAEAVKICRQAGIRIVMITGDYGLTAASLARRIGLVTSTNPLIFTGTEIDEMSDVALANTLSGERELIFARMAPEHKLRLVAGFQSLGEVVAVTGDGVNDAPALRKADVGMAMGIVGTDVAKEAADLIITNDNFISIVRSIEEGRAIYENLRKFITYIFASNVPEVLPFLVRGLFSIPLALTFKQILAIDLGTDLLPALALGTEKPEPDIMQRPPRSRSQPLVDRALIVRSFLWLGLLEAGLCYLGFFLVYELSGYTNFITWPFFEQIAANPFFYVPVEHAYELAITVFFVGAVMAQVGNAFACRTERLRNSRLGWLSNRSLLQAVLVEVVLVLALVYFPPLQEFWGHEPVPLFFFILLPLYAPLLYTLEWIRKLIVRRR